jgi:hypothetical protein
MSGHEEMRERFVQLCMNVPERLAAERSKNARDEYDIFCSEKRVTHVLISMGRVIPGINTVVNESNFYPGR